MLDRKVTEFLNTQVNQEFYSAYLYLDFANYYEEQGLSGFSNWYRVQAQEERDHAMLFIQYLQNNGEHVSLEAVAKPDQTFSDNTAPLKAGLAHERYVTGLIHTIYDAAYSARDFRTMQFLDWFIREQGEEEKSVKTIGDKYTLFVNDQKSLYMLDGELKTRVYTPAAPADGTAPAALA